MSTEPASRKSGRAGCGGRHSQPSRPTASGRPVERLDQPGKKSAAVGRADRGFHMVLRMRHHAEHIAPVVEHAGDGVGGAVDIPCRIKRPIGGGVAEQHPALALDAGDGLRVERSDTPFTRGYNAGQVIRVPVAHGEGNYVADSETVMRLEGEGRVAFRYVAPDGKLDPRWNINGATNAIAGILNDQGNVLGLMPHPENHVEDAIGPTDGRGLFAGLTQHFAKVA